MRKKYRYKNLSFPVSDNTEVKFTIEYQSSGIISETFINIPGDDDPEIEDSGTVSFGKGSGLRDGFTVSVTDVSSIADEEDTIAVNYKLNGQLLVEHSNPKSEEESPMIILQIKFPAP